MQIKTRFRSRSEHTLDAKGRLSFPRRFRDVFSQLDSDILMITTWGKHLRIFPLQQWEMLETNLLAKGSEQPELASFVRLIVSGVTECSLDKQGRLLLPQTLRSEANLRKDVVLTGMLDWVEIWDKEAWEEENRTTHENFDSYQAKIANLGMF